MTVAKSTHTDGEPGNADSCQGKVMELSEKKSCQRNRVRKKLFIVNLTFGATMTSSSIIFDYTLHWWYFALHYYTDKLLCFISTPLHDV